jgi:hypothetical protein
LKNEASGLKTKEQCDPVIGPGGHFLRYPQNHSKGENMSKSMDTKKTAKKEPSKSLKEKRAAKKAKKEEKKGRA